MAQTQTERPRTVELGRYRVSGGERVLISRINRADEIEIYDTCAKRTGRTYLVKRGGIRSFRDLAGVVNTYRAQARRIDAVPMRPGADWAQVGEVAHLVRVNGR